MSTLPPFARALQGRRTHGDLQDRHKKASEDPPEYVEPTSARPPEVYPSIDRRKPGEPEIPARNPAHSDEVLDLRLLVSNLESQNADLTAENKRLQRVQVELETERQLATEYKYQLEDTITQLQDEQAKVRLLQTQVQQLENLLDNRKQLTDVKEQMLQRIQTEYQQVMKDYSRILELNGVQTGQLRQARVEISELEAQVEELKGLSRRRPSEPLAFVRTTPAAPAFADDFPLFEADTYATDIQNPPETPEPEFDLPRTAPPKEPDPVTLPKPRTPLKRAALVDNIDFGSEPTGIIVDDVDSMSVDEMKDLLSVLRGQKEEVERRLNKAPEKGRLMAHVRREQEEKEHELDVLSRRIAKLRWALRKIHEL
jgi:archaellum component FlaC